MSNWYVGIDRDGQPFIEHAFGQRAYNRVAPVKYFAKIGEGAKARYFYTMDQLRSFQQGAKKATQNTANNIKNTYREKSGINAKQRLNTAKENYKRNHNAADHMIKSGNNMISKSIHEKDAIKSNKLFDEGLKRRDAGYKINVKSNDELKKAQNDFNKTPLGKIEKVKEKANDVATDVELAKWEAEQKAKKAADKISDELYSIKYDAKKTVRNAKEAAEDTADKAKDKLISTSDRMKEEYRKRQQERNDKLSDAKEKANDTIEIAKDKAKDTAENAKEKVKNANDIAKEKYEDVRDKLEEYRKKKKK